MNNISRFVMAAVCGATIVSAAPMAAAATPTSYVHTTAATTTRAQCTTQANRFAASTHGRVSTPCTIAMSGWQADVTYQATRPKVTGDQTTDAPWAGEIVSATHVHGPYTFATKQLAQSHMAWAVSQVKTKPNLYDPATISTSLTHNTDGTWSETVTYHGVTAPLMSGDTSSAVA